MIPAPIPPDESQRLAKLRATGLVGSPPEAPFENAVKLASLVCGTPIALVSLVAEDRQWFKARVGLDATQTGRAESFCGHAICMNEPLVVPDAREDPRFFDNPLVVGEPNIRFYAGVPLHVQGGSAIGTLCVVDRVPRQLSSEQLEGLTLVAQQVELEIEMRRERARRSSIPPPAELLMTVSSDESETLSRAGTLPYDVLAATSKLPTHPGDVVGGRYVVETILGRGGMGVVVKATDLLRGGTFALKILFGEAARDERRLERFVREAKLLRSLDSPRVTSIFDVGNLPSGLPFIVMEFVDGTSLDVVLHNRAPLDANECLDIMRNVAEGVAVAHGAGVVHRDLKPSNLMLVSGEPWVKLLDFGVAKGPVEGDLMATMGQDLVGTVHYMSPEQVLGAETVDTRADVWSLGCIAFEMLTGELAFDGGNVLQVCSKILLGNTNPIPDSVPTHLADIVRRCLTLEASERFDDAADLARALS